ncbi:hypothetical protein DV515_00000191 [Chloebia gouldiae]|uniref:Uncharacterized protein n=1 Tax=Chloebia gouldiae TaxID=44316 RepID=A0A3L8T0L0_CHLGU|nr:hypothetical protein DV515_00000191 [Chloebia gouldiae]
MPQTDEGSRKKIGLGFVHFACIWNGKSGTGLKRTADSYIWRESWYRLIEIWVQDRKSLYQYGYIKESTHRLIHLCYPNLTRSLKKGTKLHSDNEEVTDPLKRHQMKEMLPLSRLLGFKEYNKYSTEEGYVASGSLKDCGNTQVLSQKPFDMRIFN